MAEFALEFADILELFSNGFTTFRRAGSKLRSFTVHERTKRWRIVMYAAQARPAVQSLFGGESAITRPRPFRRLKAKLAAIFGRRASVKQRAVPGYEGYGWCDSSERGLLDDIAIRQARRAII